MTGTPDLQAVLEAAQAAVGGGDYEAAERLLRDTAAAQEASLGPLHPDLASTLNNLALVYERSEKFAEAERGYRRAHAIAVASLGPRHPFVATSLKNLVDFCVARGIPIWTPAPVEPGAGAPPGATRPQPEPTRREIRGAPASASVKRAVTPRAAAVAALGIGALAAVFFGMQWRGAGDSSVPSSEAGPAIPATGSPALSLPTPPVPSTPPPQPAGTLAETNRPQASVPVEPAERPGTATAPTVLTVLNAQLCSALDRQGSPDWQCTPVTGVSPPGAFLFYTRLAAGSDTTVEHRWYYGSGLHQVMRLRVRANQAGGYRTYSSNTVSSERAGNWKVELRAPDGALLQEEHFVVR